MFDIHDDDIDFGLDDIGLDFGIDDGDSAEIDDYIHTPTLPTPKVTKYIKALDMAAALDLSPGSNTYCLLSGNFVFGDLFEALAETRKVTYDTLYLSTLGLSVNNIDSIVNLHDLYRVPQIHLIVSHYFFGVERHRLVRYLAEEAAGKPIRVAVSGSHYKIALIRDGDRHYTLHGSANLSSNHNLEQMMITEDKGLYDFNKSFFDRIFEHQTVIDGSSTDYRKAKGATSKNTWELV